MTDYTFLGSDPEPKMSQGWDPDPECESSSGDAQTQACLETARTVLADVGAVVLVHMLHVLEVQVRGGEVGRAVLAFGAR